MTELVLTADAGWFGGDTLSGPVAVAVADGMITWAGAPAEGPAAPAHHVDGVLLPGLVDHHVHTDLVEYTALPSAGVTTAVDLGAVATRVFRLAAESCLPGFDGPRVLAAGPFLTAPGGYPTDREWALDGMAWEIGSPESASRAVRALAPHRPVTVKVALNSEAGPVFDDATLRALVATAHRSGLTVTAHTEGAGQTSRAVAAGVDVLAHTPWSERLGDELLGRMARQVAVVSTLDIHGRGVDSPQRETAVSNLRRFHALGGRVRYGTDLGNGPLPLGVNGSELDALRAAELTPAEIVRALCRETGGVRIPADLVAVPEDPLTAPEVLARARTVVHRGTVLPSTTPEGTP
ncbi:amidohydrolase family protein [Allosaccharopolyspora coralli]|uniref:Amidohydrolase family protein n=1 Tax=Allosaccharopolyspora coralli TaxID=2665642 RepID=A0A5Q3QIL8_9PSEU|nr:amidohydrolase family protein [Allosaccharopolyspora coralli]QGK71375.1 amidohydrolase family protein [Allosaccharopolyspora coralli]